VKSAVRFSVTPHFTSTPASAHASFETVGLTTRFVSMPEIP
jgi:hypothetical protein